ncbi:leucine-rich repeats and immunoglobulin-like domains protein 1 [Gracilinanus agilis]|uniref:leucine-rich repeats and immunoglobulin-like domains protein 1 n=1 Tax=Gracilinanus agilis TaxID=191870 RepID=UPI001CFED211|nr:leucine-rich repeats and immunoglobulin-like domains protein 1 [Gracilinanus agilis]
MAGRSWGGPGAPRWPLPRLLLALGLRLLLLAAAPGPGAPCASNCTCTGALLDCSGLGLAALPRDIPAWTVTLNLSNNKLTEIDPAAFEDLVNLQEVHLNNNELTIIPALGAASSRILSLYLQHNRIRNVEGSQLKPYVSLQMLDLSSNNITEVRSSCFPRGLHIKELDLNHNEISGTIEDTNGAFTGLDSLNKLTLFGNKIKSVAKRAFSGLEGLEHLNLGENAIRSIQFDAFAKMKNLQELHISSDSFLCDCQLKWMPPWLMGRGLQTTVVATCAHPESLKGQSIFSVPPESFVCDDFPKPQIITQPETTMAVAGKDIRFTCSAASSSSSPMTFAWKKDNEVLPNADIENFAHVRAQAGELMEYTTILHLRQVTFHHEGRYQCVITNHFGSTYSHKARLTVNVLPSFTKIPHDIAIRTGTTARLECAASGHPNPQIAWQKDGGTDFPAARERRMLVMPDDVVFFITDVKLDDMGVYSCTAQNSAGSVSANATLTVLETPSLMIPLEDRVAAIGETVALQCKAGGSPPPRITWLKGDQPVSISDRHHFTPGNQLLVIQSVAPEDAARYTCEMSNALGTERAHSQLSVLPAPGCRKDGTTVGIFTIAVVCSIVLTSLVWVCIIYQTRKKSEEYSVTNTDETIVPPDVPSYLSSQGTLSDRQDGAVRTEGGHQANGHIESNGVCQRDPGLNPDVDIHTPAYRQPKLCIGHNKEVWKVADGAFSLDKTDYGMPATCSDFSENATSYSQEKDSYPLHKTHPSTRASQEPSKSEQECPLLHQAVLPQRGGSLAGPHPEGNGSSLYPSNHDRMPAPALQKPSPLDHKGGSLNDLGKSCESESVVLHPLSLGTRGAALPAASALPSGFPELGGSEAPADPSLPNGHLPKPCDSAHESTALRGSFHVQRNVPLLFVPNI